MHEITPPRLIKEVQFLMRRILSIGSSLDWKNVPYDRKVP